MKGDFHGHLINGSKEWISDITQVKKSIYWKLRESIRESRIGKHDLYWGCHACDLEPGHPFKKCVCSCGAKPTKNSIFWGEDFAGYTSSQLKAKMKGLSEGESQGITVVEGDLKRTIVNGKYDRSRRPKIRRGERKPRTRKETGHSG